MLPLEDIFYYGISLNILLYGGIPTKGFQLGEKKYSYLDQLEYHLTDINNKCIILCSCLVCDTKLCWRTLDKIIYIINNRWFSIITGHIEKVTFCSEKCFNIWEEYEYRSDSDSEFDFPNSTYIGDIYFKNGDSLSGMGCKKCLQEDIFDNWKNVPDDRN